MAGMFRRQDPAVRVEELRQEVAAAAELRETVEAQGDTLELMETMLAQLELAMEDRHWVRLAALAAQEFSREGLRQISAACQIYAIKNPLIKRALTLRQVYVWGQGVEIGARANGRRNRPGEQDVNAIVQEFLDDPDNRRAFTDPAARERLERALGTDGNVFISLWTKPTTGRVQVRVLPWDEVDDVVCNPDDRSEPWYYLRRWQVKTFDPRTGTYVYARDEAFYPAVNYRPRARPATYGGISVRWDAPVRHVKVNDLEGWTFGVGDAYAAVDWARAYKEFLEDWAKLVKALSRFAWRVTTPGNRATAVRAKLAAAPTAGTLTATGDPNYVGAAAMQAPDVSLEAIPKTGATIDSESGRPLAAMVSAATGVPVTMLLGDPGVTGARATAETLDQPTELEMEQRRNLWTGVLRDVLEHVVREAVRAPQGRLRGTLGRDDYGRETVALVGDTEQTVDVNWPDLSDVDQAKVVKAVVEASAVGVMPPQVVLRLLLTALGVQNVDELVEELTDAAGNFEWPEPPPMQQHQADQEDLTLPDEPVPAEDDNADGDGDGDGDGDASGPLATTHADRRAGGKQNAQPRNASTRAPAARGR